MITVTPNLRGAALVDLFRFEIEVRHLISFTQKNVSKILKRTRVIEKKRFVNKS